MVPPVMVHAALRMTDTPPPYSAAVLSEMVPPDMLEDIGRVHTAAALGGVAGDRGIGGEVAGDRAAGHVERTGRIYAGAILIGRVAGDTAAGQE